MIFSEIIGRHLLMTYESSNPAMKVVSKDTSTEDKTVDIDFNINLNDNDEERINQPKRQKARTANDDSLIREAFQGTVGNKILMLN